MTDAGTNLDELRVKAFGPDAQPLTPAEAAALTAAATEPTTDTALSAPRRLPRHVIKRVVFLLGGALAAVACLLLAVQLSPVEMQVPNAGQVAERTVSTVDMDSWLGNFLFSDEASLVDHELLSYEPYETVEFFGMRWPQADGRFGICIYASVPGQQESKLLVSGSCSVLGDDAPSTFDVNVPGDGFSYTPVDALGTDMLRVTVDADFTLHIVRQSAPN